VLTILALFGFLVLEAIGAILIFLAAAWCAIGLAVICFAVSLMVASVICLGSEWPE